MILLTWVLAFSASNAAEMADAESETATWAGVVPLARKSSFSAAVSAAAWATVIVTSLLPLSETMTLSTWVLPFRALKAPEMFEAVSETATASGVVPFDWNSSFSATVSAAACAAVIVTSCVALSETMTLLTKPLAASASNAPEMFAAESDTAARAGVVVSAWNISLSTVVSAAA